MPIYTVPPASLVPTQESWWIENFDRGGGTNIVGGEQIIASMAQRWRAQIEFTLKTEFDVMQARAMAATMRGRVNNLMIGPFDFRGIPWPVEDGIFMTPKAAVAFYSGGGRSNIDDGFNFLFPETLVKARVVGLSNVNSETIVIHMDRGSTPQQGCYFSVEEKLYMILSAIASGVNWNLTVQPTLRLAHADGASIRFVRPRTEMKAISADQIKLVMTAQPNVPLSLDLVEAFY